MKKNVKNMEIFLHIIKKIETNSIDDTKNDIDDDFLDLKFDASP